MVCSAHFVSDRLGEVGFTQSDATIYNEGIKGICAWFLRDGLSGPAGNPVTVPLYKYIERYIPGSVENQSASSLTRVLQMDSLPDC